MAEPMWVITVTEEEWQWLSTQAKSGPESLRFALDSATPAQEHMTVQRSWREQRAEYMEAAE